MKITAEESISRCTYIGISTRATASTIDKLTRRDVSVQDVSKIGYRHELLLPRDDRALGSLVSKRPDFSKYRASW